MRRALPLPALARRAPRKTRPVENRAPRSPRACRLAAPASSSPPWPSPRGVTAHDRGVVGLGVIGNVPNSATVCPVLRALPHAFHGPSPVPPSTLRKRFHCRSLAQMRKLRVGAIRESVRNRPGGEGRRAGLPVRGACAWASTGQLRQATDRPTDRPEQPNAAVPAPPPPSQRDFSVAHAHLLLMNLQQSP